MKFNQKQILLSIVWCVAGVVLAIGGAVSSGAGHGPNPHPSIAIAIAGAAIFAVSALILVVLVIKGLLGKGGISDNSNYQKAVPDYDWRCPKCDSTVQANTVECLLCGHRDS